LKTSGVTLSSAFISTLCFRRLSNRWKSPDAAMV
jgi:hypothetical protein